MIFISGVHGVGKTYFCNVVKEKPGIEIYSASQLIAAQKREGDIPRISLDTYVTLGPNKILLLSEKPSVITEQRFQRDGVTVSEDMVGAFQQEAIKYAKEVVERLNIPLIISAGSSDIEK